MCTLSIIPVSAGLRIVANRDELRDRPAALAPCWQVLNSGTRALWPVDPKGGGTWIGAADSGLVLCLMNLYAEPGLQLPRDLVSRGLLIPRLIGAPGMEAVMEQLAGIDLHAFAPFRLMVIGAAMADAHIQEATWDRRDMTIQKRGGAPQCFVSSGLGDVKVQRRLALFDELVIHGGLTPLAQDRFHLHVWPDHPELSVLMSRPEARTVSITTVEVSLASPNRNGSGRAMFGVRMGYQPVLENGRLGIFEAADASPVASFGRGG